MRNKYYVYILTNYLRTVLYIGVTNNLCKRVWEHKEELISGFTKEFHIHDLMYFEVYTSPIAAIEREKQLKSWSRKKKDTLIQKENPQLVDLYAQVCK